MVQFSPRPISQPQLHFPHPFTDLQIFSFSSTCTFTHTHIHFLLFCTTRVQTLCLSSLIMTFCFSAAHSLTNWFSGFHLSGSCNLTSLAWVWLKIWHRWTFRKKYFVGHMARKKNLTYLDKSWSLNTLHSFNHSPLNLHFCLSYISSFPLFYSLPFLQISSSSIFNLSLKICSLYFPCTLCQKCLIVNLTHIIWSYGVCSFF